MVAGPPLFLGSLPARQPEQFYALLPFRPASLAKVHRDAAAAGFYRLSGLLENAVALPAESTAKGGRHAESAREPRATQCKQMRKEWL